MSQQSYLERKRAARERGRAMGSRYRSYMKTSTRGLEIGVGIVVGVLLGTYADSQFDSKPIGALIGLALGVVHAIKLLYIIIQEEKARAPDAGSDSESVERQRSAG